MTDRRLENIEKKLTKLSENIEKARIAEYIEIMNNPKKLIFYNFIGGLARGLGTAIGLTFLVALLVFMLRKIVDLPLIGEYIADLLDIIERNR